MHLHKVQQVNPLGCRRWQALHRIGDSVHLVVFLEAPRAKTFAQQLPGDLPAAVRRESKTRRRRGAAQVQQQPPRLAVIRAAAFAGPGPNEEFHGFSSRPTVHSELPAWEALYGSRLTVSLADRMRSRSAQYYATCHGQIPHVARILHTFSPLFVIDYATFGLESELADTLRTMLQGNSREHGTSRILIVDDHPIVRQGYAFIISSEPDLDVCGFAKSEADAIEQTRQSNPHLVIVDIMLEDGHGIELVKRLSRDFRETRTLVISAYDELLFAERALDAGACGYLNKHEAIDALIEAMRQVLRDEIFLSPRMSKRLLRRKLGRNNERPRSQLNDLSDRELQVFRMIGQGMATRHIAQQLSLSPRTVERYRENIKQKLRLRSATQLVQSATKWVLEQGG